MAWRVPDVSRIWWRLGLGIWPLTAKVIACPTAHPPACPTAFPAACHSVCPTAFPIACPATCLIAFPTAVLSAYPTACLTACTKVLCQPPWHTHVYSLVSAGRESWHRGLDKLYSPPPSYCTVTLTFCDGTLHFQSSADMSEAVSDLRASCAAPPNLRGQGGEEAG